MKLKHYAQIAARQFDTLYKRDKTADFIEHCHKFFNRNNINGCSVGDFEMMVYDEYSKI